LTSLGIEIFIGFSCVLDGNLDGRL
jgi:hypothetical protein